MPMWWDCMLARLLFLVYVVTKSVQKMFGHKETCMIFNLTSLVRFESGVEPGLDELGAVSVVWVKGGRERGADEAALIPKTFRVKVAESEEDRAGDHVLENGLSSGVPHIDRVMTGVTR